MIPKIIHQTWKTEDIPFFFKTSKESIHKTLPNWQYVFWTDKTIDEFIKESFSSYYNQWNALDRPIKKVDVFRYFLLYQYGGIYVDMDFVFTKNIEELLVEDYDIYFYQTTQALVKKWEFLGNAFMISKPGQDFWLQLVDYMFLHPNTDVLQHTGPRALGKFYNSLEVKPHAKIFSVDLFDNAYCQDGLGLKEYGFHQRTGTWQQK
jgi:mannosyltransferase OCH1-like enzyme